MKQGVVAVVVTYRRLPELTRLLDCLARSTVPLLGCVISDHSPDGSVVELARQTTGLEVLVREDASNPGPGAGWSNAATMAIEHFGQQVSALWYLDDDVVPEADCLEILLEDLKGAGAIAPLLSDTEGTLWAFPEPEDLEMRRRIRTARTPADARLLIGDTPLPACWATGACILVTRKAYERVGGHRTDFWLLGEDLEYSMRLADEGGLVFTCRSTVPHLPAPSGDAEAARRGGYVKFCSLLQNLSYLSFHSSHSRHMRSYLPGNYRRFFRTYGWGMMQVSDAARCLLGGIVRGQPAGGQSDKTSAGELPVAMIEQEALLESRTILSTRIHCANYESGLRRVIALARRDRPAAVSACNTHLVSLARYDVRFHRVMQRFDLIVPDGYPLVWSLNAAGAKLQDRVYGPYFMRHVLANTPAPWKHFFFGGTPECLERLVAAAKQIQPDIEIAGVLSPPFRQWTEHDQQEFARSIQESGADFIWVALGVNVRNVGSWRTSIATAGECFSASAMPSSCSAAAGPLPRSGCKSAV